MSACAVAVPLIRCALLMLWLASATIVRAEDEKEVDDVMDLPGITVTAPREEEPEPGAPPKTVEERFRGALGTGRLGTGKVKESRGPGGRTRVRAGGMLGEYCMDYDPARRPNDLGTTLVLPTNCPK